MLIFVPFSFVAISTRRPRGNPLPAARQTDAQINNNKYVALLSLHLYNMYYVISEIKLLNYNVNIYDMDMLVEFY